MNHLEVEVAHLNAGKFSAIKEPVSTLHGKRLVVSSFLLQLVLLGKRFCYEVTLQGMKIVPRISKRNVSRRCSRGEHRNTHNQGSQSGFNESVNRWFSSVDEILFRLLVRCPASKISTINRGEEKRSSRQDVFWTTGNEQYSCKSVVAFHFLRMFFERLVNQEISCIDGTLAESALLFGFNISCSSSTFLPFRDRVCL